MTVHLKMIKVLLYYSPFIPQGYQKYMRPVMICLSHHATILIVLDNISCNRCNNNRHFTLLDMVHTYSGSAHSSAHK